jgi:hypothetical protein
MKKQILIAILTAGFALALVFTLSCSEDKSDEPARKSEPDPVNIDIDNFRIGEKADESGRYATGTSVKQYADFLGKGYDVIHSPYWTSDFVSKNYIIDPALLCQKGKILVDNNNEYKTETVDIFEETTSEYMRSFDTKLGLNVGFGSFKAGFETDFGKSSGFKKEHIFGKNIATLTKERHYLNEIGIPELREMVREYFRDALMNNNIDKLFEEYGTHVMLDVLKGGRFEINYLIDNTSNENTNTIKLKVEAGYKAISATASNEEVNKATDIFKKATTKIMTYGGMAGDFLTLENARKNYGEWAKSINREDKLALVGVRTKDNGLIPIWWLIDTTKTNPNYQANKNRFNAIEKRYNELLKTMATQIENAQSKQPSPKYVKMVYMGVGKNAQEANAALYAYDKDIVIVDANLNEGKWSWPPPAYIHLGYTTTSDPDGAITDIEGNWRWTASEPVVPSGYTWFGINTNKGRPNIFTNVFLLYSTQKNKRPIKALHVQFDGYSGAWGLPPGYKDDPNSWTVVVDEKKKTLDLNDNGPAPWAWLWMKR